MFLFGFSGGVFLFFIYGQSLGNGVSVQLADKLLAAHVLMLFVNKLHTDPVSPEHIP